MLYLNENQSDTHDSPPNDLQVTKKWSYISTTPMRFIACTGTNFTFKLSYQIKCLNMPAIYNIYVGGERFSAPDQTCPGVHLASYTGSFLRVKRPRVVALTTPPPSRVKKE
jgi:hypothetical protein